MGKFTDQDIKLLANQFRVKKDANRPFTMLTGAGCSKSAGIPLAEELVAEIHRKFGAECEYHLKAEQLTDYGAVMGCLSKNDRRDLLSPYLNNSKINWAHIAIASLMHSGFVGRVITFNFDSILARACGLIGLYPATYDFAAAATVNTDYIAPQAIIHLHGQGWGKSILNSDQETSGHVENIRPLIRSVFQDSPLLVVGYSGISDPVFSIISQEYNGRERLWWAGYSPQPNDSVKNLIDGHQRVAYYLGGCDADEFLIELTKELGCFPPELFRNPYSHLLKEIEPIMDFPFDTSGKADLLTNLKNELNTQAKGYDTQPNIPALMMNGQWMDVIEQVKPIYPEHQYHLAWAYIMRGQELVNIAEMSRNKDLTLEAIKMHKKALEISPEMFEALHSLGKAKLLLGRITSKVDDYEKSIEMSRRALAVNPASDATLANWGTALAELGELTKNIELIKESFFMFQRAMEINPLNEVTLNCWGASLLKASSISGIREYLDQAINILTEAEKINPSNVYNLACAHAHLGEKDKCKNLLHRCKTLMTLPPKLWMEIDPDLNNVKNTAWFKELMESHDAH